MTNYVRRGIFARTISPSDWNEVDKVTNEFTMTTAASGCHGSHGFSSTKTLFPRVATSLILHPGFQLQGVELQLFATLIQATEVQPASTCCPKFLRFLSYVCPRVVAALFAKTSWSSMWSCQLSTICNFWWLTLESSPHTYSFLFPTILISLRSQSILPSFWNNTKSILTAEHLILLQCSRQPFDGHTPCFLSIKPTSNPSSHWKCCPNSS